MKLKEALPLESVTTPVSPMNFLPSASPLGLEKSWMVKALLGVLLRVPLMIVALRGVLAEDMRGKFWWLLAHLRRTRGMGVFTQREGARSVF